MHSPSRHSYSSPCVHARLRDDAELARELEEARALRAALSILVARILDRLGRHRIRGEKVPVGIGAAGT